MSPLTFARLLRTNDILFFPILFSYYYTAKHIPTFLLVNVFLTELSDCILSLLQSSRVFFFKLISGCSLHTLHTNYLSVLYVAKIYSQSPFPHVLIYCIPILQKFKFQYDLNHLITNLQHRQT